MRALGASGYRHLRGRCKQRQGTPLRSFLTPVLSSTLQELTKISIIHAHPTESLRYDLLGQTPRLGTEKEPLFSLYLCQVKLIIVCHLEVF